MKQQESVNIIHFIPRNWERFPRRHILRALAEYARILCVEPPITLLSPIVHTREFIRFLKKRNVFKEVEKSIYVFTPFAVLPHGIFNRFPLPHKLRKINNLFISFFLKRVIKRIGMEHYILDLESPNFESIIDLLKPSLKCYQCTADWTSDSGDSKSAQLRRIRDEENMLKKVDMVFVVSEELLDKISKIHLNTFLIPNGSDFRHFSKALDINTSIPEDISWIRPPRIGFIGYITTHVDIKLLNFLAKNHPEWSIVIIGEIYGGRSVSKSEDFIKSRNYPNIHYLGWRDYKKLPNYLKAMDVCLLPFKLDQWIMSSQPNKTGQYLSAGKPVVSMDFPEAMRLDNVIRLARNHEEFEAAISEALGSDNTELINHGLKIAKENSAEYSARMRMEIMNRYLWSRS
jgi:glycosyltransferase involved in cell wall biosynthesis